MPRRCRMLRLLCGWCLPLAGPGESSMRVGVSPANIDRIARICPCPTSLPAHGPALKMVPTECRKTEAATSSLDSTFQTPAVTCVAVRPQALASSSPCPAQSSVNVEPCKSATEHLPRSIPLSHTPEQLWTTYQSESRTCPKALDHITPLDLDEGSRPCSYCSIDSTAA